MLPASVEERLAHLTPDQRAAATAPPGPILCVAPAGSGKTTTLVARIAWRVASGTPGDRIRAVTFNKRAAVELGERVDAALAPLGQAPGAVRVGTLHALGREILVAAGVPVEPLLDRSQVLAELAGAPFGPAALRRLDDAFSRLKLDLAVDTARLAHEVAAESAAGRPPGPVLGAFLAYEGALAERGGLDFDDFLRRVLVVLEARPILLAAWRERCATLLVDEAQDLDRSQLRLALLLAAPANDVFLVGDDDQTIYAWRLADVRRILGLAADLPGLRRVDLVTNFRCPPEVVRRAVRLVEHNRERFAKRIRAAAGASGTLRLLPDPGDDVARARSLLRAWGPDLRAEGSSGSHAILARTNAELAPYAAVAIELDVPYRAAEDGLDLLEDPGLIDLLARAGPDDDAALPALSRMAAAEPVAEDRMGIEALLGWAAAVRPSTLGALRQALGRAREQRQRLRRDDASLVLATAHATKGLEFDHVACVGHDAGRFPSRRSLEEAPDPVRALEEERRLAYVAWTRARRELLLLHDPGEPSPFLEEAFEPEELRAAARATASPATASPATARAGPARGPAPPGRS
ncbi:MAG TPA: ATP-dependent helicase [Candidatus Limnocylindrales bacterium]|nr:ATP-dependent helicase [Candidatus Limnocylindrales bacterium]